ncbi:unnamed protein product [Dicrocoelium dendriticum]|nr:unnamed protein product [Dicrocoelium dendriticum]
MLGEGPGECPRAAAGGLGVGGRSWCWDLGECQGRLGRASGVLGGLVAAWGLRLAGGAAVSGGVQLWVPWTDLGAGAGSGTGVAGWLGGGALVGGRGGGGAVGAEGWAGEVGCWGAGRGS